MIVKNRIGTFKIYVLMWKKGISKLLPEVAANTSPYFINGLSEIVPLRFTKVNPDLLK